MGLDLRIRRFSAASERLLNLIPGDVGRPIAYLRTVMKVEQLEKTVADAIDRIATCEQRVQCTDGATYRLRIVPYRTGDLAIRGAVLELTPPPEARRSPLEQLVPALLARLPRPMALLDGELGLTWFNPAFAERTHVTAEALGRPFGELLGGREQAPELLTLLEDAARSGKPFEYVLDRPPLVPAGGRSVRMLVQPFVDGPAAAVEGGPVVMVMLEALG